MTDRDPNETARMPTPPDPEASSTEGWPGSTAEATETQDTADVPAADAAAAAPATATSQPADDAAWSGPRSAEPAWSPAPIAATARKGAEPDHGRAASVVFGLILLTVGLWFFAEQTLGLELPRIRWSQFWPVILIGLGVWIVLASMRRGSR